MEEIEDDLASMPIKEKKKLRTLEKNELRRDLETGRNNTWDVYCRDEDFIELRRNYDRVFAKKFHEAYKNYIDGDWATAEDLLNQCAKMNPRDGPTITLKNYIEELNGRCPDYWKGFRELTEK